MKMLARFPFVVWVILGLTTVLVALPGLLMLALIALSIAFLPMVLLYALAVGLLAIVWMVKSVRPLKENEMIALYFFGRYIGTYVNQNYCNDPGYQEWKSRPDVTNEHVKVVARAWFGTIAFVPWLLTSVRIFPTTKWQADVRAGGVITAREEPDSKKAASTGAEKTRLIVDSTVHVQVSPYVHTLLRTIPFRQFAGLDLTKICRLETNHGDTDPAPVIAKVFVHVVKSIMLGSIRKGATPYTWLGARDILEHQDDYELDVVISLAAPESLLVKAGILLPIPQPRSEEAREATRDDLRIYGLPLGPSVISWDITFEDIRNDTPSENASAAETAMDEAAAASFGKRKRARDGEAFKAFVKNSKLDKDTAFAAEVAKEIGNINVLTAEKGILSGLMGALRGIGGKN